MVRSQRDSGHVGGPRRNGDDDDEAEVYMMKNEYARGRGGALE
jgi:hypothetical protein